LIFHRLEDRVTESLDKQGVDQRVSLATDAVRQSYSLVPDARPFYTRELPVAALMFVCPVIAALILVYGHPSMNAYRTDSSATSRSIRDSISFPHQPAAFRNW